MGKKLDSTGLSTFWGIVKSHVASRVFGGVPLSTGMRYTTCATESGVATKVVALSGFVLSVGAEVLVRFTVTNTASVSDITLNVNNTGAKAIRYRNSVLSSADVLATNRTYRFVYDGTYWQIEGDLDTNTTYSTMTTSELNGGTITDGRLVSPQMLASIKSYMEENALVVYGDAAPLSPTATYKKNSLVTCSGETYISSASTSGLPTHIVYDDGEVVTDDGEVVIDGTNTNTDWTKIA